MFSLESPHRGDSNEYTHYTIFNKQKGNHPKLSQICSYAFLYQGTQERVRNSRGERAISVRATEVLLYYSKFARDRYHVNPIQKKYENLYLIIDSSDINSVFSIQLQNG